MTIKVVISDLFRECGLISDYKPRNELELKKYFEKFSDRSKEREE